MRELLEARALSRRDFRSLAGTLARAFHDDPVWSWLFPDVDSRSRRTERAFRALLRSYAGHGVVRPTAELSAVALWQPPRAKAPSPWLELLSSLPIGVAFGSAFPRAFRLGNLLAEHRPRTPHRYLGILGTDPSRQGEGLGSLLVREGLELCRREGVAAYLESSNPTNVPFYRRHGFEVIGELTLARGPSLPAMMWRP